MNERDWKRLKALYKKHVRMARKIRWRVYKGPHGEHGYSGRFCPFSHFPRGMMEPPFGVRRWTSEPTAEWTDASELWMFACRADPARVLKEFGWRVER